MARISRGAGIASAAYALARQATIAMLEGDAYDQPIKGLDYATLNGLLAP